MNTHDLRKAINKGADLSLYLILFDDKKAACTTEFSLITSQQAAVDAAIEIDHTPPEKMAVLQIEILSGRQTVRDVTQLIFERAADEMVAYREDPGRFESFYREEN